jgi:hypothetical protein
MTERTLKIQAKKDAYLSLARDIAVYIEEEGIRLYIPRALSLETLDRASRLCNFRYTFTSYIRHLYRSGADLDRVKIFEYRYSSIDPKWFFWG